MLKLLEETSVSMVSANAVMRRLRYITRANIRDSRQFGFRMLL